MLQRNVALAGLFVIKGRVAMAESATATVLAGKSHRGALEKEGSEGESLRKPPIVGAAIFPNL